MTDHHFALPGGLSACFRTACAVGPREIQQLRAYVPGLAPCAAPDAAPDIVIEHTQSQNPHLTDHGNRVRLETLPATRLPADCYHLFYGVVRRALMARGLYTVHAACAGTDDRYILLGGHSGAGKTTVTHNLVTGHGARLFSGNKTVIRFNDDGTMTAVAGTMTMTALDKNLARYAYDMPAALCAPHAEVPVRATALVRINDGVTEAAALTPASALHTLYPFFMDAVNADIIVNGKDILDGIAPRAVREKLAAALARAAAITPSYRFSGTVPFLLRHTAPLYAAHRTAPDCAP